MPVKLSGLYSNSHSVSGLRAAHARARSAPPAPRCRRCRRRSRPNTTRRCTVEVELYRCTIARRAPRSDSNVRSISSGRACVSTWIVDVVRNQVALDQLAHEVEVGLRRGREADLDFLEAGRTSRSNMRRLRAASIGSISAWLPSRRSTLHHSGGVVITLSGQVRSREVDRRERAVFVWWDPATS